MDLRQATRHTLLACGVAGIVLVAGLVAERAGRFGSAERPSDWEVEADLVIDGIALEEVTREGTAYRLTARQAKLVEKNRRLRVDDLAVAFYEEGAAALNLTADHGEVALDTNRVTIRGAARPATLALADGTTVRADAMHWDPATRTVRSEGAAQIDSNGFSATGGAVVARVDERTVRLVDGVTVTWTP